MGLALGKFVLVFNLRCCGVDAIINFRLPLDCVGGRLC